MSTEENTSESFKPLRQRSDSTSSCTSITSSDDEGPPLELTGKGKLVYINFDSRLPRVLSTR